MYVHICIHNIKDKYDIMLEKTILYIYVDFIASANSSVFIVWSI